MSCMIRGPTLSLGELQTILCQVEGCLNYRLLTPLNNDPNDFEPLTPEHFLIGGPMMFHTEPIYDKSRLSSLKRWNLIQCLLQKF